MKVEDGLLLPLFQPEIPGNPGVMLIALTVAVPPVIELAGRDAEPSQEQPDSDLGLL
jgi:hypothetical protein